MGQKIDTRSIGLDVGLSFIKWLTGAENLHYGLWDGLEVTASNLRAAQDAYTEKLFGLLPKGTLRILDIGGGAGETAKKLVALGHDVEIVVPSAYLASRCRAQAPQAVVHEMMFEDLEATEPFDLCLFSESFQYIPLAEGLPKCLTLLKPGGHVILADCFRTPEYSGQPSSTVGGGHFVEKFHAELADLPFETVLEEDITRSVAASVDLEQGLFNVFGLAAMRVDDELALKRPKSRWILNRIIAAALSKRRRERLAQRLFEQSRNADVFCRYNIYMMMKLRAPE